MSLSVEASGVVHRRARAVVIHTCSCMLRAADDDEKRSLAVLYVWGFSTPDIHDLFVGPMKVL